MPFLFKYTLANAIYHKERHKLNKSYLQYLCCESIPTHLYQTCFLLLEINENAIHADICCQLMYTELSIFSGNYKLGAYQGWGQVQANLN